MDHITIIIDIIHEATKFYIYWCVTDPMELYGESVTEDEGGPQGVTSQMVLLCSWRTVKEVSLLLGFLAEEATIALEPEGIMLNEKYNHLLDVS